MGDERVQKQIRLMDDAITKNPLPDDTELKRIAGYTGDPAKEFEIEHIRDIETAAGKKLTWKGFTSSTYPGNPSFPHNEGTVRVKILAP